MKYKLIRVFTVKFTITPIILNLFFLSALFIINGPALQAQASETGSFVQMKNVRFRFNEKIQLETENLSLLMSPQSGLKLVNIMDPRAFKLHVLSGRAALSLKTLNYIFNQRVLKGPGVNLRRLVLQAVPGSPNLLDIRGQMKQVIWVPFRIRARIHVDPDRNQILLTPKKIGVYFLSNTLGLMNITGLVLQKLMRIIPGRGLSCNGNQMIIDPYKLLPPPALSGRIASVAVKNGNLNIHFGNTAAPRKFRAIANSAPNFLLIRGGKLKIDRLRSLNGDILMVDRDPRDSFDVSFPALKRQLRASLIRFGSGGSLRLVTPDFGRLK